MSTLRETVALVLLYRACADPVVRRRVRDLVPAIDEALAALESALDEQPQNTVGGVPDLPTHRR